MGRIADSQSVPRILVWDIERLALLMGSFQLAELRVYGAAHDSTTRAAVESELSTKWAL